MCNTTVQYMQQHILNNMVYNMYTTCCQAIYNISTTSTTHLQQIYKTNIQQHMYNNIYTTNKPHIQHAYNNIYTTKFIQQHISNDGCATTELQQHIYNNMCVTTLLQHHKYNNMYTTPHKQHIYNTYEKYARRVFNTYTTHIQ